MNEGYSIWFNWGGVWEWHDHVNRADDVSGMIRHFKYCYPGRFWCVVRHSDGVIIAQKKGVR